MVFTWLSSLKGKRNKLTVLAAVFSIILLQGCAFQMGSFDSSLPNHANHYRITDVAWGRAQTVRVLGIGGMATKTLVNDAKMDLYRRYPLQRGQAFANTVVDTDYRSFILWDKITITISADVVQLDSGVTELHPFVQKVQIALETPSCFDVNVGDKGMYFDIRNSRTLSVQVIKTEGRRLQVLLENGSKESIDQQRFFFVPNCDLVAQQLKSIGTIIQHRDAFGGYVDATILGYNSRKQALVSWGEAPAEQYAVFE